ncbi:hypothetical protein BCV71DRAFT_258189 [Rhizopus microsporus]|uniref:Uncharacterized protein n=1 Tax=Rhizopus microsporus TaxID=58291 RepID=A0A1X0RQ76_RHIZD|nr:hypothetical protein BCV71DRAFT_258189 [Rhizopus microsporus]
MTVCSRISMQYLSMMLNTSPGLTTVARFITQLEAFRQPKGELWDIRLESLQGAGYLRSQLRQIVNDASCCLAGAKGYISYLTIDKAQLMYTPTSFVLMVNGQPEEYCHSSGQNFLKVFWHHC